MQLYPGKKVYGPYTRRDGRRIVILKTPGSHSDHQTVSYPKYQVEMMIGRYLEPDETVDHIDGNFLNDDPTNLRVIKRSQHCRSHTTAKVLQTFTCIVCGTEFQTTEVSRKTCGDKRCMGKCAWLTSIGQDTNRMGVTTQYESLRHTVDSIQDIGSSTYT